MFNRGGGCLFNLFPKYVIYLSELRRSQKDPVSLIELRNITPLADLGLLRKVGWAFGNESADPVLE